MKESVAADIETRVRRLERQNRIQGRALIVAICAAIALGSIAVSHAQSTVITAYEVRAQRFSLIDPNGGLADDWYAGATRDAEGRSHPVAPYSGWGFSKP